MSNGCLRHAAAKQSNVVKASKRDEGLHSHAGWQSTLPVLPGLLRVIGCSCVVIASGNNPLARFDSCSEIMQGQHQPKCRYGSCIQCLSLPLAVLALCWRYCSSPACALHGSPTCSPLLTSQWRQPAPALSLRLPAAAGPIPPAVQRHQFVAQL